MFSSMLFHVFVCTFCSIFLVYPRILKVLLISHIDRPIRPCIRSLQVHAILSSLCSHNLTSTPRILFSFIRSLNSLFPGYCQFSHDNLLSCRRSYHDIWSSGVYKMSSENCNRFVGSTRICPSLAVVSIYFNSNTADFIKKKTFLTTTTFWKVSNQRAINETLKSQVLKCPNTPNSSTSLKHRRKRDIEPYTTSTQITMRQI